MSCGGCGCCRKCGCQATCTCNRRSIWSLESHFRCNRSIWSLESHCVDFSDVTSTGLAVADERSASAWPSSSPDENGACCIIRSNWHGPECGNQAGDSTVG